MRGLMPLAAILHPIILGIMKTYWSWISCAYNYMLNIKRLLIFKKLLDATVC
jgi:hypothetical protein